MSKSSKTLFHTEGKEDTISILSATIQIRINPDIRKNIPRIVLIIIILYVLLIIILYIIFYSLFHHLCLALFRYISLISADTTIVPVESSITFIKEFSVSMPYWVFLSSKKGTDYFFRTISFQHIKDNNIIVLNKPTIFLSIHIYSLLFSF